MNSNGRCCLKKDKLMNNLKNINNVPSGDSVGNFIISSPCVISGGFARLISDKGAVLTINSDGVELSDICIELTDPRAGTSLRVIKGKPRLDRVYVNGKVEGIDGEDGYFGIPTAINLGKIPADRKCTALFKVNIPCKAQIKSELEGVEVYRENGGSELSSGENLIRLDISPTKSGALLAGDIIICTALLRRIFFTAEIAENVSDYKDEQLVFEPLPENEYIINQPDTLYPDNNDEISPMPYDENASAPEERMIIERGMLVKLDGDEIEIELIYDNVSFPMEVDAFAFMSDENGNVTQNDRFVFFGNDHSADGSVKLLNAPDKKVFYINLKKLPNDVDFIDFAWSIYDNPLGLNLKDLSNPAVRIHTSDGKGFIFILPKPLDSGTVVGIELLRKEDGFRLSPLGMLYPKGLESLCRNYGLHIKY